MKHSIAFVVAMLVCACSVEPPCPAADLAPLTRTPAWAVLNSDFGTTAVALLERDGTLITEAWIDSGTTRPGITATLSGDVVLPTRPLAPGVLSIIDRRGVDVLTRIAVPMGNVLGQAHLQSTRADETGFQANPLDAVTLDDGRVLVSRHSPNLNPGAEPFDRGDDLVILDAAVSEIDDQISLASLAGPDGSYFARPARMARAGRLVIVGLARLSQNFDGVGPGAIGVLDPATEAVTPVDLPGMTNCGTVTPVDGDPQSVIVLCDGDTFSQTADQLRPHAGIVILHVDAGTNVVVQQVWRASEHTDLPVPSWAVVSLGGTRVAYDALGLPGDGISRVVVLDLASDAARIVLEAHGDFVFGDGAYDAAQRVLLIPDVNVGLRRFDVGDGFDVAPRDVIDTSPCRRLPPRQVRAL